MSFKIGPIHSIEYEMDQRLRETNIEWKPNIIDVLWQKKREEEV